MERSGGLFRGKPRTHRRGRRGAGRADTPERELDPGFLCGLEFDSLSSELAFFSRYGLRIGDAEIEIPLGAGELLIFDNLAAAHGRRGTRQPGELRHRVFGHHLQPAVQSELRDRVLAAFYAARSAEV